MGFRDQESSQQRSIVYEDQGPQYPQQDPYAYSTPPVQMNPGAMVGTQTINQDQNFMKWMFSFRKEILDPLRHTWRGHEYNHQKEEYYVPPSGAKPMMDENGIAWCSQIMETYISSVFIVSNFDEKHMNYLMRNATRDIINGLAQQYRKFGLNKINIMTVANQMEAQILAVLMGSRNDGYRRFFAQQYHIQENISNIPNQQQRPGLLSGISSMFSSRGQQQY